MRKSIVAGVAAVACWLAGTALADPIPYSGTLSFQFGFAPLLLQAPERSGVASTTAGGGLAFPSSAIVATVTTSQPPGTPGLSFFGVGGANLAGTLTPVGGQGGGFGGALPFDHLLIVSDTLGSGVFSPAFPRIGFGGVEFSLSGQRFLRGGVWTTGPTTVSIVNSRQSPTFARHSAQGYDNRSVSGGGRIQFVTPIRIVSQLDRYELPAFGIMTLEFVPEPAALVALAAGALGLFAVARSRS